MYGQKNERKRQMDIVYIDKFRYDIPASTSPFQALSKVQKRFCLNMILVGTVDPI
jgi:hypothetical protein